MSQPDLERERLNAVRWSLATFPNSDLAATVNHLRREVQELEERPDSPEEMADCAILLARATNMLESMAFDEGVDLAVAVRDKLAVLETRTWGEPDAEGVIEHVRESG